MENVQANDEDVFSLSAFDVEESLASQIRNMAPSDLLEYAEEKNHTSIQGSLEKLIYACVIVFLRLTSWIHLQQAIERAERWCSEPIQINEEKKRRLKVVRTLSALERFVVDSDNWDLMKVCRADKGQYYPTNVLHP
jgi:hypothetical protein